MPSFDTLRFETLGEGIIEVAGVFLFQDHIQQPVRKKKKKKKKKTDAPNLSSLPFLGKGGNGV